MTIPEDLKSWSEALSAAKSYADAILLNSLNQVGGILSDTIGHWRLRNQVRLMLKTKEYLEEKKIRPEKILPEIFIPLLEDGGNVENEDLTKMFASLLASHLDPDSQDLVHPSYTKVLAQISPLDAKVMVEFRKHTSDKEYRDLGLRGGPLVITFLAGLVGIDSNNTYLSCLNLNRLGIIHLVGYQAPDSHPMPYVFEDSLEHQEFRITEYGISFCDACHHCKDDSTLYWGKNQSRLSENAE